MSKAIVGASLLAVAGGVLALATGGVSLAAWAAVAESSLSGEILGGMLLTGLSMEAGSIADALTSNRGMNITTRQAAANRQIIYGQQRVGGVMIYKSTTGSAHDQMNFVIVLAGHECQSIENLYLDGRQVHWQGSGAGWSVRNGVGFGGIADGNTYTGPDGVQYNFGGTGHSGLYCEARYGDQAEGDVISALTANDPNWAADGSGNTPWVGGCTYIYLKLEYNTTLFPSEPEIRVTVNGKNNIYDPRTGTTGFTQNAALIAADVITDTTFGLGDNTVNQAQLIAAANVCDETVALGMSPGTLTEARYTTNYHYDTSVSPGDAFAAMLTGMAGRVSRIGGEWYIWPAYWQGPSFSFDENVLTAPLQWKPYRSVRELINRVNGTYIAPSYPYNIAGNLYDQNGFYDGHIQNNFPFAYQPTNFPQYAQDVLHGYASDQWLNEDGGIQHPQELSLRTVLSVSQAQRVAKIVLLRNRQQGSGTLEMSLPAFQMQPTDVMSFTFVNNGWNGKSLEVNGISFHIDYADSSSPSIGCTVKVVETDPSVYEWNTTEELTVYDVSAVPTQIPSSPAPPTNMTLLSGAGIALISIDGSVSPRIEVQWNTPEDILTTEIQVQYQLAGSSVWLTSPSVDVSQNFTYISGVTSGQPYNVRIRSLRPSGAYSVWEEIDGFIVSITTPISYSVTSIAPSALVADALSDGTAEITVYPFVATIGSQSVTVLPRGSYTITGLSQATLYYVYYADINFLGGAVTPIATQNTADFLAKQGYYLIGEIQTPVYATGTVYYRPSSWVDQGTRGTYTPQYAYDNNVSTAAVVEGSLAQVQGGVTQKSGTKGSCTFYQFPAVTIGNSATLNVVASINSPNNAPCSIVATIGDTTTTLVSSTTNVGVVNYTLNVPSGTNLSGVTVTATADGTGLSAAQPLGMQIYIQDISILYVGPIPITGADLTALNTSADTSAVGGVSSAHISGSIASLGMIGKWWRSSSAPTGGGDLATAPLFTTYDTLLNYALNVSGGSVYSFANQQIPPMPSDGSGFSYLYARWTGYFVAPLTGTYTIGVNSDDGANLYVNGTQLVSDLPNDETAGGDLTYTQSGTIALTSGVLYPIIVEWQNGQASGAIQLLWTPPGASTPSLLNVGAAYQNGSTVTYSNGATVDSLRPAQAGADVTSSNTAAGITNQGALATIDQTDTQNIVAGAVSSKIAMSTTTIQFINQSTETVIGNPVTIDTDGGYVKLTVSMQVCGNVNGTTTVQPLPFIFIYKGSMGSTTLVEMADLNIVCNSGSYYGGYTAISVSAIDTSPSSSQEYTCTIQSGNCPLQVDFFSFVVENMKV